MKPTLAVLITYFNEKTLLTECLHSLQAQTCPPDEVLIYDDASQFPPEEYFPPDFQATVIHGQANKGPAYGRNVLLRSCRSDYLHFQDADDLFQPDWCRRVKQAIQETSPDAVFVETSSFTEQQKVYDRVMRLDRLAAGEDPVRFGLQGSILAASSVIRKETAIGVGGYRESMLQAEDFDFHIRLVASGVRYTVITDPLILQRLRDSSYSTRGKKTVWKSVVQSIRLLSGELPGKYRKDLADAAARAGSMLFRLGARPEAREAFQLCRQLGPPTFSGEKRFYRVVAWNFGPEVAEQMGEIYRRLMPKNIRSAWAGKK